MRCKYCGSQLIYPETQHKTFSTGKAVAGAVTFGVAGAAAGFIGKDQKGYKCGACGAFMETTMDFMTESSINRAVKEEKTVLYMIILKDSIRIFRQTSRQHP